ncbi:MAG: FKBP-type peptidyl-prolyl cis-trans isomerase [Bacteroidota bacterium]
MRTIFILLLVGLLLPLSSFGQKKTKLETQIDSISYALGTDIANNLKRTDLTINAQTFYQGLADALAGENVKLTDQETRSLLGEFQRMAQAAAQRKSEERAAVAKEEGELFLQKNKEKKGIQVTESGLQYEVLREGDGPQPTADNTVTVHYEGRLLNEKIFDSSYQRGETIEFPLRNVIPGWTEGVQLMKTGSKFRFYIPSDLAYGPRGAGNDIGPNETLIFDIELVSFK